MNKAMDTIAAIRGHKLLIFIYFLYLSSLWAPLLHAEPGETPEKNEVFAIGTGDIVDGNLASAKKSAISQALMKGVENYLMRRLGSEGVINNFKRLIQEIIPNAKEDIENFHILTEEKIADKYKVLVGLRINEKVINEKLREAGVVLAQGPPIKVLFLVSEAKEGSDSYWWKDPEIHLALSPAELVLHNVFQERGFSPVNRTLSVPEAEFSEDLRSLELEDSDVLMWGKLFFADVAIYGRTEIVDENKIFMTLKALDVNQGIQICQGAQLEEIGKGPEGNEKTIEILQKLVNNLSERLTPAIIRFAAAYHEKIHHLEITLRGLSTHKNYRVFKDFLSKQVKGVKSVRQTRLMRDSLSISVEFQGDREQFLNRVLSHEALPFPVEAYQTEEGEIVIKTEPVTW